MKWTIDNINHRTYQVLGLDMDEVIVLQSLLRPELPKLQKLFDKISDVRESAQQLLNKFHVERTLFHTL